MVKLGSRLSFAPVADLNSAIRKEGRFPRLLVCHHAQLVKEQELSRDSSITIIRQQPRCPLLQVILLGVGVDVAFGV